MSKIRKFLGLGGGKLRSFRMPENERAYAIGDIHGRLDLLRILLGKIEQHSVDHPCAREYIIFLGDLIDRGPDSRGVIDLLLRARPYLPNPVFIAGNHEEMLLRVLSDDVGHIHDWLSFGGAEFAESYGLDAKKLYAMDSRQVCEVICQAVPAEHLDFLSGFADSFAVGDYFFTHAGVRPGIPLTEQSTEDLHWIREDFLDSPARFPAMIVHGHTIAPAPEERPNRIGIDTGAYRNGVLTALCVEGETRQFLSATL